MNKKPTYLKMVTANNNNKFYNMFPKSDGTFYAKFGREGTDGQETKPYPMSEWDKTYNSKIKKGYVDYSDMYEDLIQEIKPKTKSEYKEIDDIIVRAIVDRLQDMAQKSIQKNYKVGSNKVTQAMVDRAQEKIDEMSTNLSTMTVDKFNKALLDLFGIIPRKMAHVQDYLAKSKDDFGNIIQREQDTLDVMKGQVVQKATLDEDDTEDTTKSQTILDALGLVITQCSKTDMAKIKELFGSNAKNIKNAWCVTNVKTQKRFDDYIAANNLTENDIKLLLHGSSNANWWSIAQTGLSIRPSNAASNGRMLGDGNYLANDVEKSRTYTDRSSWRSHKEPTGFIGIMATAYGKPYDINAFNSKYYSFNWDKLQQACPGANCLHAHRGMDTGWCNLRYDEIVVYKEEQCTIKYLVEFE